MPPRKKRAAELTAFESHQQEGEALQQRAERRRGREALPHYEQACAAFRAALQHAAGTGTERVADAWFGLGECLQNWGEGVLEVCAALPDAQLSAPAEAAAAARAVELFGSAVDAYRRVGGGVDPGNGGSMRVDAAVCCANTLSAWAEVEAVGVGARVPLLAEATSLYRSALAQEEDALTWSNLADVLAQHAALLCDAGEGQGGGELYRQANEAYCAACALSSSENGDDLPGLLLNWGVGLLGMAKHEATPAAALGLLTDAAQRLREAAQFERGDPAPHNALGDVLLATAEAQGGVPAAAGAAAAAVHAALHEGYAAALRINQGNADALVGRAEALAALARLLGDGGDGGARWAAAAEAYTAALARPEALGCLADRAEVRYNFSCCLSRCGRREAAGAVLAPLLAGGLVTEAEVGADPDLEGVLVAARGV